MVSCSASVPLAQVTACLTPTYSASCCSNSCTSGPIIYLPCSSTVRMRASILSCRCLYCACKSINCIINPSLLIADHLLNSTCHPCVHTLFDHSLLTAVTTARHIYLSNQFVLRVRLPLKQMAAHPY